MQQNDTSLPSITNYNIDAERFIPLHKREQWDKIPLNIIAMGHPYLINSNASDEFQELWVRNVQKRVSPLEPCAYNILHQKMAKSLLRNKVKNIEKVSPDFISTGNVGCITQISTGTRIPIIHTVELLDWFTGGPKPYKLKDF